MKKIALSFVLLAGIVVTLAVSGERSGGTALAGPAAAKPSPAAVERARREVRLLDDVYKTSVVLITQHYVEDEDSIAAAVAAKALFGAMKEKGWHEARLIDASGHPYNDENLPQDGFEKRAVKEILSGKASYDEVVTEDGKSFLLAATTVPVVMDKCIMCHENYRTVPKNQAIGAISYKVPVLE
ncbi:MAG: DUF3365 domain-containing protein [Planctomycetaceae bacterium]|nr:DUF3365 domain-containing protein [Planctomycetaceae bacterium]